MTKTLLILGGYGNCGRAIADLLLQETVINVIIAGRNLELARQEVDKLNTAYSGERARARKVDASSPTSLEDAFRDIDMVVVASSTTEFTYQVVNAALNANIDYIDIQVDTPTGTEAFESLQSRLSASPRCFVTGGGFHPGLPAALVRYAATQMEHLQNASVYITMAPNWKGFKVSDSTMEEFIHMLGSMNTEIYKNGNWEKQGWTVVREHDFGEPLQKKMCAPMFLEEMRDLPQAIPSLDECGVYISGFDNVTNFVTMPICMAAAALCPKLSTKPMSKFFDWSLKTFGKPPFATVVALEAENAPKEQSASSSGGQIAKLHVSVAHEDAYAVTVVPVVACLLQILDGGAKPGLHYQAQIVEPERFLADLERLGLKVIIDKDTSDSK